MSNGITETKVHYDRQDHYVYQDINGEVLWAPTDFIIELDRNPKTIRTYRKAIRRLFKFLNSGKHKISWLEMNDSRMREFRTFCLKETTTDSRYRGDENVAKQTVNSDFLMPIYNFYHWVQKQGTYHPNILGFDPANKFSYQITSSLLLKEIAVSRNEKPNNNSLYPELFRDCDTRSRNRKDASEYELEELNNYIINEYEGYERASLLLIAQIMNETGSRPISVSSYRRLQFSKEIIEREFFLNKQDSLSIVPKLAKQGNTMPVSFRFSTVLAVRNFIENDLEDFLTNIDTGNYEGHLFLDPNSFQPLTAENISKIFSEITTELGWPKGKSIYSLRHKFSGDSLDKHLDAALELGFSANETAIALQMEREMTHRSAGSLEDYISSRKRTMQQTDSFKKSLKINELESDKTRLELERQKAIESAEQKDAENQALLLEIQKLQSQLKDGDIN
ncbi:hypothetical protein H5200_06585 [Pseudoalteromonas sp. SG43-7]|uniref:hypothetical protein n=1 Tax=Pseudoalteromonas sp. SG43-7 TaxID=2760966 RepID=UPI00160313F5|nr:hypothetical protein [Pseudoalteromonas sp. SG43-7]MBB1421583.1 hypothetical protein [Pseudoalteromonas sp. SG43-7]